MNQTNYDIFISHRIVCHAWVEMLVQNLKEVGYSVFFASWDLTPGYNYPQQVEFAFQHSDKAILIATDDAIDSGWVRIEYEKMCNRKLDEPSFQFAPITFGSLSDLPFLTHTQTVNFAQQDYKTAFYQLICGLEGMLPEENTLRCQLNVIPFSQEVPKIYVSPVFIENVFGHFQQISPTPLLLLSQTYHTQSTVIDVIVNYAQQRYSPYACLTLFPPYTEDEFAYFADLAYQCDLNVTIRKRRDFAHGLREKIKIQKHNFFLLIGRFEHSAVSTRNALISILNNLYIEFGAQLHIILCGSEQLAELTFNQRTDSLLSLAEIEMIPELTIKEAHTFQQYYCQQYYISESAATQLLQLSGGHPILLRACLQLYCQKPDLVWQGYPHMLLQNLAMWQIFKPFMDILNQPKHITRVKDWLMFQQVAPFSQLYQDKLLRYLYWHDLLVAKISNNRSMLYWRSEILRLAGQEILGTKIDSLVLAAPTSNNSMTKKKKAFEDAQFKFTLQIISVLTSTVLTLVAVVILILKIIGII